MTNPLVREYALADGLLEPILLDLAGSAAVPTQVAR